MQKSIRTLALLAVLSFAVTPALHANMTGCNPHPQDVAVQSSSVLAAIAYTALSYFGL